MKNTITKHLIPVLIRCWIKEIKAKNKVLSTFHLILIIISGQKEKQLKKLEIIMETLTIVVENLFLNAII